MEGNANFDPENTIDLVPTTECSESGTEARENIESLLERSPEENEEALTSDLLSDEDEDDESLSRVKGSYFHIPYGFQSMGCYKHASKNCEIGGVTHNNRFRQFVILDSRGITSWSYESVYSTVTRHLNYPAYQFNVLRMIIFSRKFNVYFALSKEYALKVFNLNFHEVISVSAEMHSVLCMVFNPGRNELITGGTGGMKFWRFGELTKDKRKTFSTDSRPMANYGLVLRASYPKMGGSWVKHVELDVAMQRLYCLSERNVVAYDMMGNELFQIKSAHRGPVTGCVYSKSCNLLVTTGNDCDVNVWSRSGGLVHTFSSHTKIITKIMIHPEATGVVITSSMDGMVKMFSLDIMEEIYSLPIFHEGVNWMEYVSPKILYCCSNRQIEVFSLNHVVDFWALSRCCVRSMSLVTCTGKSSRVMAVGTDSSVRLLSRAGKTLSTVLPPPSISPLNQVLDVTYSREFNLMYLLIDNQEIWVYYTRTNPATRLEAWQLEYVEDIHTAYSTDISNRSRSSTPWNDGQRSPSSKPGGSPRPTTPRDGVSSLLLDFAANPHHEQVSLTCLGMLYSNIIIDTIEGPACPDATHFLLAGTEDGMILFLHMFFKGMKYYQFRVHKGLVLGVEHDQDINTLVTQCRALNGIDVQFWSLPDLTLVQQITCEKDITCHVRMEGLFLSGHESGHIGLHWLCPNDGNDAFRVHEGKRPQSRDHQGPITSIDANEALGIFCSSSNDGFLKLWDKTKTLLREISLDDSLTAARFLNNRGDVLIGFKQHIFFISHTKVLPSKESKSDSDDGGDETFETESDIYEDPSVRYEGKKILQPDPTNMENYLVPFPNLQLKTSFFMEGRPPPDLQQQDRQDDLESIRSMSDNLSLAPTDIYHSPYSTPRSMSVSSGPAVGRRDSRSERDIWNLPAFGDSPVSSPPRTPPPEPTPPPTPPPEELTDEEENKTEEQEPASEPPCEECKTPGKVKEKKIFNFPSFKKDGGRMSNVRIDSKSLRGRGLSGPGYAAPVVRQNVYIPEPKPYKPRRPPKIIKKTKKPKEKPDESQKEQTENPESTTGLNDPTNTENKESVTGLDTEEHAKVTDDGPSLPSSTMNNFQNNGSKQLQVELKSPQDSVTRNQYSRPIGQNVCSGGKDLPGREDGGKKDMVHETGVAVSEGKTPEGPLQDGSSQQKKDNSQNDVSPPVEANESKGEENNQNLDDSYKDNENMVEGDVTGQHPYGDDDDLHTEAQDGTEEDAVQVVYVDPHTGQTLVGTLVEVPEGAKIIEIKEDRSRDNDTVAMGRVSKQNKRPKTVTFDNQQSEHSRRAKSLSKPKRHDSRGDIPRLQRGWGPKDRTYVVPSEDFNPDLQDDIVIRGVPRDSNVSPLAIFALARNRKESTAKRARRAKTAQLSQTNYPLYSPDKKYFHGYEAKIETLNFSVNIPDEEDAGRPSSQLSITERVKSSKKPEDDVVKWCVNALKKTHTQLFIPEKPSRPGSSQSASVASVNKEEATWGKDVGVREGQTLFINVPERSPRPKSSATFQSTESREEFSMYPYKGQLGSGNETNKKRLKNQIQHVRAKTAPPCRRRITDIELMQHDSQGGNTDDPLEPTRDNDGYYTDFYRIQSPSERPLSSLDFPTLDVEDYSGNWQEIVLARARLLKKQRIERQKSAKERRETQHNEQKERWKKRNHLDCAKAEVDKPEPSVEFNTSYEPTPQQIKPTFQDHTIKQLKEQELSSEQPFRLRIHPRHGSASLISPARSLITIISHDHNAEDIARVMPRPKTAASIPNKCSKFVLVSGDPNPKPPRPTKIEQTLMLTRFPNRRALRKNRPNKHKTKIRETLEDYKTRELDLF